MADVNQQLARGRPFFIDIVRDGVVLYELGTQAFDPPKPLSPEEAREEAQQYFDKWFASASGALKGAKFYIAEGDNSWAALPFLVKKRSAIAPRASGSVTKMGLPAGLISTLQI